MALDILCQHPAWNQQESQAATYSLLEMSVQRQTTLLAYLDSFMVVGIVCLVALPLVFLMKHDRNAIMGEVSAH